VVGGWSPPTTPHPKPPTPNPQSPEIIFSNF